MNNLCKRVQNDWKEDLKYLGSLKEDKTSYTWQDIKGNLNFGHGQCKFCVTGCDNCLIFKKTKVSSCNETPYPPLLSFICSHNYSIVTKIELNELIHLVRDQINFLETIYE